MLDDFTKEIYNTLQNELESLYKNRQQKEDEKEILTNNYDQLNEKLSVLNIQRFKIISKISNLYDKEIIRLENLLYKSDIVVIIAIFIVIFLNIIYFNSLIASSYRFMFASLLGAGVSTICGIGISRIIKKIGYEKINQKRKKLTDSKSSLDLNKAYNSILEKIEFCNQEKTTIKGKINKIDSLIQLLTLNINEIEEQISEIEKEYYQNSVDLEPQKESKILKLTE